MTQASEKILHKRRQASSAAERVMENQFHQNGCRLARPAASAGSDEECFGDHRKRLPSWSQADMWKRKSNKPGATAPQHREEKNEDRHHTSNQIDAEGRMAPRSVISYQFISIKYAEPIQTQARTAGAGHCACLASYLRSDALRAEGSRKQWHARR